MVKHLQVFFMLRTFRIIGLKLSVRSFDESKSESFKLNTERFVPVFPEAVYIILQAIDSNRTQGFVKAIYSTQLGIFPSHWKRNAIKKNLLCFVCEFRRLYDIKLTSACNGLLLFAKEENRIYRSGNVILEFSGIGKDEAVHFSQRDRGRQKRKSRERKIDLFKTL